MSPKTKRIFWSVPGGVFVQCLLFLIASNMNNVPLRNALNWNFWLVMMIAFPRWGLAQATPTAIPYALAAVFVLGVATYDTAIYYALKAFDARRARDRRQDPTGS